MTTAPLPPAVRTSRTLAVSTLLALIVLGLAWELWLAPTGRGTLSLKVVPLAFAVPGLLKCRLYTYRWVSLVVWVYVAEGALRATTEQGPARALAIAELALSMLLFAACALHVRSRLRPAP